MEFLWPSALLILALIPGLILLLALRQRRRRRFAVRYSSLSLVRAALPEQSRLRRILPLALFFVALTSLVLGLARPVLAVRVPAGRATVMLTLDVSGSMRQADIAPSRLAAAKKAAIQFVDRQKNTNQVGIVAFAGIAQLVHPPSTDSEGLKKAIRNLTTARHTAIGDGIVTALETIANLSEGDEATATPTPESTAAAAGGHRPDIIVLLTDGVATRGIDPLEAAEQARAAGVRVYTIAFGTDAPAQGEEREGYRGSYNRRWGIDEESLKAIAALTGGEYYTAGSTGELEDVFDSLPIMLVTREETLEMSVAFAALAALMVIGAVLLSQLWRPLP